MGASFLNLVATKVTVKGEEQKFVSLHLRQGFNRHHTFTVVVNYLSPNNTFQQTPENSSATSGRLPAFHLSIGRRVKVMTSRNHHSSGNGWKHGRDRRSGHSRNKPYDTV